MPLPDKSGTTNGAVNAICCRIRSATPNVVVCAGWVVLRASWLGLLSQSTAFFAKLLPAANLAPGLPVLL